MRDVDTNNIKPETTANPPKRLHPHEAARQLLEITGSYCGRCGAELSKERPPEAEGGKILPVRWAASAEELRRSWLVLYAHGEPACLICNECQRLERKFEREQEEAWRKQFEAKQAGCGYPILQPEEPAEAASVSWGTYMTTAPLGCYNFMGHTYCLPKDVF